MFQNVILTTYTMYIYITLPPTTFYQFFTFLFPSLLSTCVVMSTIVYVLICIIWQNLRANFTGNNTKLRVSTDNPEPPLITVRSIEGFCSKLFHCSLSNENYVKVVKIKETKILFYFYLTKNNRHQ